VRDRSVTRLLFLAILIVAVLPLGAAFYFLDHALQTSLDLGFNAAVVRALDKSADSLKTLKRLDPANTDEYRQRFDEVGRLQRVYAQPAQLKQEIRDSLRIYFGVGVIAVVVVSLLLAALLGRRITKLYGATFDELMHQRERTRYLEEMGSWQELARMLAHEIKNPLTPIEVLISSLSKSYTTRSPAQFQEHLQQTQTMIAEELEHLKSTVNKFSEFARLPAVQPAVEDLSVIVPQLVRTVAAGFERADARVAEPAAGLNAAIDVTLLRRVLTNVIRNGVEANPDRRVVFEVRLGAREGSIDLEIGNDGQPAPPAIAARMFDPYVSGNGGKDNMGLGLAIVKKIVIEHGGEVSYRERLSRPVFIISLPRRP
jgi:signal transduction histidine kinase